MHLNFKPVKPLPGTDAIDFPQDDDQRYWGCMKEKAVFTEPSNLTSVDVMSSSPFYFASTSSIRLAVWDPSNCESISINSRFKAPLFCATYRKDGQILACGTQSGQAIFFDIHNIEKNKNLKNPIRIFQLDGGRVNSLAFEASGRRFSSASDDAHVRMFDLADTRTSSDPIWSCEAHNDHVRHCSFLETDPNMLLTASYDHTIKLWDIRQNDKSNSKGKCMLNMNHGAPVERILVFPGDRLIATAGSTFVKLWDLTFGGRLLHSSENHIKTVTSLCFGGNGAYLVSGGLDQQICFTRTDCGDFPRVHRIRTDFPVLAMAISQRDKHLAIGSSNVFSIYSRKNVSSPPNAQKKFSHGSSHKSLTYAASVIPQITNVKQDHDQTNNKNGFCLLESTENGDIYTPDEYELDDNMPITNRDESIENNASRLENGQFDFLIRSRKYRELISVMMAKQNLHDKKPELFVAAFQQLRIRQVLRQSLAGDNFENVMRTFKRLITNFKRHSPEYLVPLFRFIKNHIFNFGYFDVLYDVANTAFALYADQQMSSSVKKILKELKDRISKEVEAQIIMSSVLGGLDMLSQRAN